MRAFWPVFGRLGRSVRGHARVRLRLPLADPIYGHALNLFGNCLGVGDAEILERVDVGGREFFYGLCADPIEVSEFRRRLSLSVLGVVSDRTAQLPRVVVVRAVGDE